MEALDDLSECCAGADAVVFAAGAGPGSGPERKQTVDYGAAVKLMDGGAASPLRDGQRDQRGPAGGRGGRDAALPTRRRPGRTSASPTAASTTRSSARAASPTTPAPAGCRSARASTTAKIPRDDVAAVLLAVLETPEPSGKTFELVSGDTPVDEAVRTL